MSVNRIKAILDQDGNPYRNGNGEAVATLNGNGHTKTPRLSSVQLKALAEQANSFLEAIGMIGAPALLRATDPFSNNPWVFTSAMQIAIAGASVPLKIWREKKQALQMRQRKAIEDGGVWQGPRAGDARRAKERHLHRGVMQRLLWKANGIDEDLENPLHDVLIRRPNEYQNGKQMDQFIKLWLATRFECGIIKGDKNGKRLALDTDKVESLWPYGPDHFEPALEHVSYGRQVGWWFTPPKWGPHSSGGSYRILLRLGEVVHLKFPNPNNPLRGMARMTAVAPNIELDELSMAQLRSLLKRGASPKGIMAYEGVGLNPQEIQDKQKEFDQLYGGEENAGSTVFIHGGWKYQPIGFSPQQLENRATLEWNRDAELAAMGSSLSALGISSADTYAAELIHDKGLWTKTIIPINGIVEDAYDDALFHGSTDDIFPAYDYRDNEALRAGLEHQVNIADKLASQNLHVPPRLALEVVGLQVDKYPADDKAFLSGMLSTAEDLAAGVVEAPPVPPGSVPTPPTEPTPPGQQAPSTPADGNPPENAGDGQPAKLRAPAGIAVAHKHEKIDKVRRRWADFVKVQFKVEKQMREAFRGWVNQQKREILSRFDEITRGKAFDIDLTQILPDPNKAGKDLRKRTRPAHGAALEGVWGMTQEEIGVPTIDIGDDRIVSFFDRREKVFLDSTVGTLIKRVRTGFEKGVQADETIQEIRVRVSDSLNVEAGSSRGLLVARTESAGFMNGVRNEIFGAEGFEEMEWVTAGDQNVRDSHVEFGAAGPKPRGFNYLSLVGEAGQLTYPGDIQAPAGEVVNCRCLQVPAQAKKALTHGDRFPLKGLMKRFDEALALFEARRASA